MGVLSRINLELMGFKYLGSDVQISDKASFYGVERIQIGNHVRIDDFCVLSAGVGGIEIGNYIHIAVYTSIIGAGKVLLSDFCNLSSRVSIYSSSDDYSGDSMTNPMIPAEYTGVVSAQVVIGRHVIVGSGSVILPGVILNEGVAVGALSLINRDCEAFFIYAGQPARPIKRRNKGLLLNESKLTSLQRVS